MKTYHLPKPQEEFRPILPIFKKHDGDKVKKKTQYQYKF